MFSRKFEAYCVKHLNIICLQKHTSKWVALSGTELYWAKQTSAWSVWRSTSKLVIQVKILFFRKHRDYQRIFLWKLIHLWLQWIFLKYFKTYWNSIDLLHFCVQIISRIVHLKPKSAFVPSFANTIW